MATFYTDGDGGFLASLNGVAAPEGFTALEPNTVDAATEKHVPAVDLQRDGHIIHVQVGEVEHPMTEEHLIQWVVLETSQGWQQKKLAAGDAPEVKFALAEGEAPVAAWAYCNLHGLWKTVI